MIRRLLAMVRCRSCDHVGRQVGHAYQAFLAGNADDNRRLLDMINRSMPDVPPYPPERMSEAIAEVTRRSRSHARLRAVRQQADDTEALADEVLRMTDP